MYKFALKYSVNNIVFVYSIINQISLYTHPYTFVFRYFTQMDPKFQQNLSYVTSHLPGLISIIC